ncbi:MAG: hypothetical protein ABFR02_07180 [Campylobacterota bacterium]
MKALKSIRDKIFIGLIQGIGFGLVFGLLYNYTSNSSIQKIIDTTHDNTRLKKIVIQDHKKVIRDNKIIILGSLKNNNPDGQRGISVQVDIYDAKRFVEQCRKNIKGTLKPQEVRNFKISCDGIVKHDSYEVYLLNNFGR